MTHSAAAAAAEAPINAVAIAAIAIGTKVETDLPMFAFALLFLMLGLLLGTVVSFAAWPAPVGEIAGLVAVMCLVIAGVGFVVAARRQDRRQT